MITVVPPQTGRRFHALDNLRGLMMWLGIVLHSAMVYMEPRDVLHGAPQTSLIATLLFGWIHTFRMPLFFILAGFFAALILERRGLSAMLVNRAKRIVVPFLLFWPILLVLINMIVLEHGTRLDENAPGINSGFQNWIISTGHMWFLYYLAILTLIIVPPLYLIQYTVAADITGRAVYLVRGLMTSLPGLFILSVPGTMLSFDFPLGIMRGDSSFVPGTDSLTYYGLFYFFGILLYCLHVDVIRIYEARWPRYLCVSLALYLLAGLLGVAQLGGVGAEPAIAAVKVLFTVVYSFAAWTWSAFFLGFFSACVNINDRLARYLSDSSYWVYLSHYPVVLALALIFYDIELPALLKMTVLIALTTATCLLAWHFVVRNGPIGRVLYTQPQ